MRKGEEVGWRGEDVLVLLKSVLADIVWPIGWAKSARAKLILKVCVGKSALRAGRKTLSKFDT